MYSFPRVLWLLLQDGQKDAVTVLCPFVSVAERKGRRIWVALRMPYETTVGWDYPFDKREDRKEPGFFLFLDVY